ncbi:hypothetical protein ACMXYV_10245 [Neptuniibacter sp. SY11_33]|uniref:hypothetical protein n=1 Tax=Neptuniibacter sp. SY11_33 TaxID=3398215 RepID=UPI0039F5633A
MTDYLCLPTQFLSTDESISTTSLSDTKSRIWYCAELPELTQEIKESLTSEYAYAAWELTCLKVLLDLLKVPAPKMFDEWPSEIKQLSDLAVKVQDESDDSLGEVLGSIKLPKITEPIDLASLHPIQLTPSQLSKHEQKALLKHAKKICKQHRDKGSKKYFSGELRSNRYNYAKDIIRAADFSLELVEGIPTDYLSIESITKRLQQGEHKYLLEYEDMEGFGIGTIRNISNYISKFESKFPP